MNSANSARVDLKGSLLTFSPYSVIMSGFITPLDHPCHRIHHYFSAFGKSSVRALILGFLIAWASPSLGLELKRTDPAHKGVYQEQPTPGLPKARTPQRPANAEKGSRVLFQDRSMTLASFPSDNSLSSACRRGRFAQALDQRFIVRLKGGVYGAAIGGHWSLRDPGQLSEFNRLYVIRNQSNSRCRVYPLQRFE